jgi:hypothetical protein
MLEMQKGIDRFDAVINIADLELLADRLTNGIMAISPYIVRGFAGAGDTPTPGNFGISTGRGWGGVSNVKM